MGRPTFRGGVHPPTMKGLAEKRPITPAKEPQLVVVPLHQHTGAPADPLVKVGDTVAVGQKIADSAAKLTSAIHSPISGTVKKIGPHLMFNGKQVNCITIENDGEGRIHESVEAARGKSVDSLTPDEIKEILRESGIVGMGGAAFPTYFKLSPPPGKTVEFVILNGAECEPYLTADHRIMVERADDVVYGLRALMKAAGVSKGYIGIEANKPDAIEAIRKAASGVPGVEVVELEVKYPQGGEKQLIKAITGREVPPGGLPLDVGVVVNNVGTAAAVARRIKEGMPLIERVVTVTGNGIASPGNFLVKIGTLAGELIDQAGGYKGVPGKVIFGGPMMGVAAFTVDVPITKGTSGILVLPKEEVMTDAPMPCVKCGKCVEVCPMGLMPAPLHRYAEEGMIDRAEAYNAMDCIECGSCAYICPSRRPLVHAIRYAKSEIMARRNRQQAK